MSDSFSTLVGLVCVAGLMDFVALGFAIWMTRVTGRLIDDVAEVTEE